MPSASEWKVPASVQPKPEDYGYDLDAALTLPERRQIDTHLQACSACRDELDAKIKEKKAENETLKMFEPKLAEVNRNMAILQQQLEIQKRIVPEDKDADQFIKLLHDTAATSGIEIRRYTAMPVSKMKEAQARYGRPLLEVWGMTEIAGAGTMQPFYGENRLGSIGLPVPYAECRIADVVDAATTLPDDEIGELMIRGPLVMQGYFGNERATRETIEPDGWLHTGDIARRDRDGYYYIVDRKKDMIITGGENVYSRQVEDVIYQHPAVVEVAVIGLPDEHWGENVCAVVVLEQGATTTAQEIVQLKARIAFFLPALRTPGQDLRWTL